MAAQTKKISDSEMEAVSENTGRSLAAQQKVKIRIPVDPRNEDDSVVPVGINGYFYYIRRGESAEVPAAVAALLENAKYL